MRYTRSDIVEMDEANLRLKVLKPLFEKMGFRDVFHYHGGSGEKGKDFVMWKTGELGERVNYAVVVKAERITGKAAARSGSASEVSFQIHQALGSTYLDSVTGETIKPHLCWVVSSREISKEAEEAIVSALDASHLHRNIRFVSGDCLWKLVTDHFPESAAMENLKRATEIFDTLDKDWRVAVSTSGGKNIFSLEPKDLKRRPAPLKLRFNLKFPDDAAGRQKAQEVKDWYEKGRRRLELA
jgi:hypothetical protein